ncbi:unnamed protein product [Rotaria sp. Silwood2]|nr:unnamed protein product [Rotaria sp. Silwood2]
MASEELRTNTLSTVRYAEFCLPGCNSSRKREILICKQLVPFLNKYMPYLQTLRLWRPDDFSWTSIRPDYEEKKGNYGLVLARWLKSQKTSESIHRHVAVFEQDLCELVKNLKEFTFLDIYGEIYYKKVEPYRLMTKRRFRNSRIDVDISRFRLWL